jgi:hypothetical protein
MSKIIKKQNFLRSYKALIEVLFSSIFTNQQLIHKRRKELKEDNYICAAQTWKTLNRIVNRFMSAPFNWPVPNVGDTLQSYTEA